MYRLNKDTVPTGELIKALVDDFKATKMARLQKLDRYYKGQHDILGRVIEDTSKPNNKIVNPYPKYITDMITGYFMGSPVKYGTQDDENLMEKLQDVLDKNADSTHNMELSKQVSIFGVGFELLYLKEVPNAVSEIRYALLEPDKTFMVYDNSIDSEPLFAVRFYEEYDFISKETKEFYEVYTSDEYIMFTGDSKGLVEVERLEHFFGDVPVIEYKNNAEGLGDFELVLSLIDAYDLAVSDTANDLSYFSDAYMKLTGMELIDPSQVPLEAGETFADALERLATDYPESNFVTTTDLIAMKQNRMLILPEGSDAQFLTKSVDYQSVEVYKTRTREDIHKFSMTPDLTDKNFASNTSGVAMKYKERGIELVAISKEHMFKSSLMKRVQMITNLFNIRGGNHDYSQVFFSFTRNIPQDNETAVKMAKELLGLVSHETALGTLPSSIVDDTAYEMEKLQEEKTNPSSMYGNLDSE